MLVLVGLHLYFFQQRICGLWPGDINLAAAILKPGGVGLGCDSVVKFSYLTIVFGTASHTGPSPCLELGATPGKLSTEQTLGLLLI